MRHALAPILSVLLAAAPPPAALAGGLFDSTIAFTPGAPPVGLPIYSQTAQAVYSYTAAFGGGPPKGDLMLAYGYDYDCTLGFALQSPMTVNVAGGWNSIDAHLPGTLTTPPVATLAYKFAGASEPASQTPFTGSPISVGGVAIVDLTDPSGAPFASYSPTDQIVDNTYVVPGTAFPVVASPAVTPTGATSLLVAFGGWDSCATGTLPATPLTMDAAWGNVTQTSGASSPFLAAVISGTQQAVGTATVTATIKWSLNAAYGLDGAIIVFNHP